MASRKPRAAPYQKPGKIGGGLIRELIRSLRAQNLDLPIGSGSTTSHILIACSGGPDSTALAHLLLKYGRRVANPRQIALLHVDHGWRAESKRDARFVRALGRKWKVPVIVKTLEPPAKNPKYDGRSWEDAAREQRKAFFDEQASERGGVVLTAHQADDLAETLLWRLFSGTAATHGAGMLARHGIELRPLLRVRKSTLLAYLREEKQRYLVDSTNQDPRFLRARLRTEILPRIEQLFPRAVENLIQQGLDAQGKASHSGLSDDDAARIIFGAAGIRERRAHWDAIRRGKPEIHLPGGWKLTRRLSQQLSGKKQELWTLERIFEPLTR